MARPYRMHTSVQACVDARKSTREKRVFSMFAGVSGEMRDAAIAPRCIGFGFFPDGRNEFGRNSVKAFSRRRRPTRAGRKAATTLGRSLGDT
jgi:hypothetical protein